MVVHLRQCCGKKINENKEYSIQCANLSCKKWSHQTCVNIPVKKLKESAKTFKCNRCASAIGDLTSQNPCPTDPTNHDTRSSKMGSEAKFEEILQKLSKLDSLEVKIDNLTGEIAGFNTRLTELEKNLESNRGLVTSLQETVCQVRSELATTSVELQKGLSQQDLQSEQILQYLRKNSLLITGVPVIPGEDLRSFFERFSTKAGYPITSGDIQAIHRVPTRVQGRHLPIVVKLFYPHHKKGLIDSKPRITTSQLNIPGPEQKIYVNDHLTPKQQDLFSKTRQLAKELGGSASGAGSWTTGGKIFFKCPGSGRGQVVSTSEDLQILIAKLPPPQVTQPASQGITLSSASSSVRPTPNGSAQAVQRN